jgi:hypothetical protein
MRGSAATLMLLSLGAITAAHAGSPESCIGVLRAASYDETTLTTNGSLRDIMHHAFCNSEIRDRADADKTASTSVMTNWVSILRTSEIRLKSGKRKTAALTIEISANKTKHENLRKLFPPGSRDCMRHAYILRVCSAQ